MNMSKKIVIIFLIFLLIINISYFVFADTKKYELGLTEEDLDKSREELSWSELYKKYENHPEGEFAKKLILNILDELERVFKRHEKK